MKRSSALLIATLLAVMLLPLPAGAAKRLSASSEQLQALFVQRLVNYVTWPEQAAPKPGQPFIVAATDARKLKPYFEGDTGAVRFEVVQWPAENYHILMLNGAPDREAAAILKRIEGQPVLTIGQKQVNLSMGVIVNFTMVGGKIKLQVNPAAADRAGLDISSKLMKIVQIYKGEINE